jgi:hypothetical protein
MGEDHAEGETKVVSHNLRYTIAGGPWFPGTDE